VDDITSQHEGVVEGCESINPNRTRGTCEIEHGKRL